jgi:hypothetical protein
MSMQSLAVTAASNQATAGDVHDCVRCDAELPFRVDGDLPSMSTNGAPGVD